jgi:hypothetical protein
MNEGQLKRFLRYIFCILLAAHHAPRDMENRACGLFAKDLERGRITAFCGSQNRRLTSRSPLSPGWPARSSPVVVLQRLCGHRLLLSGAGNWCFRRGVFVRVRGRRDPELIPVAVCRSSFPSYIGHDLQGNSPALVQRQPAALRGLGIRDRLQ